MALGHASLTRQLLPHPSPPTSPCTHHTPCSSSSPKKLQETSSFFSHFPLIFSEFWSFNGGFLLLILLPITHTTALPFHPLTPGHEERRKRGEAAALKTEQERGEKGAVRVSFAATKPKKKEGKEAVFRAPWLPQDRARKGEEIGLFCYCSRSVTAMILSKETRF